MAKIKLVEGGFTLIPEGIAIFKITDVKHDADFGKIDCTLQTKSGQTHNERFTYITQSGEVNEGALKAFSYFARVCLDDYNLDEIDPVDLVGRYIEATVKHEEYVAKSGKNKGKTLKTVRLNDYTAATGFEGASAPVEDGDDLDDFLNA